MFLRSLRPRPSLVATLLLYAVATSSLTALWLAPRATFEFGIEDGPIENLSALLLLVAAGAVLYRSLRLLQLPRRRVIALAGFVLAAVFGFLAGEEISWGQRILNIDSNEFMLEYNWQSELNLHNLHTDISNISYHLGAFVFLVVLPLHQKHLVNLLKRIRLIDFTAFIPPVWLAFPSFVLLGMLDPRFVYTIEKPWAAALYLIILSIGLAVLAHALTQAIKQANKGQIVRLVASLILIVAALTVSHLQSTDTIPNTISEYKEFIIALALCFYALQWRGQTSTLQA